MNTSKLATIAFTAILTALIMWWWCRRCPPCPPQPPITACDTCYCPNPKQTDRDGNWCCSDRLTKPCKSNPNEFCEEAKEDDFKNADIRIDKLSVTKAGTQFITDIMISNNGDDDAACAKLEVLLPAASKFVNLVKVDSYTANWEYYHGYLRVNLGQLGTLAAPASKGYRHVRIITNEPCLKTPRCGIAAFVYSALPDLCLNNNYAFSYFQNADDTGCAKPVVIPFKGQ